MFSHLLNLRERQHPERQPHRLAATGPAGAGSALSPRGLHVPSRVGSGASVISPRSQKPVHGNDWQCADAQPAFRTLNRQAGGEPGCHQCGQRLITRQPCTPTWKVCSAWVSHQSMLQGKLFGSTYLAS